MLPNSICRLLHISFPLLQAGMGGVASVRLVAAVSNAGCLGILPLYKHRPQEIFELLQDVRSRTFYPFGVNLIPEVVTKQGLLDQVQSVLDKGDSEICFTFFGLPTSVVCSRIKLVNYPLLIQVGSLTEARSATLLGADALILQGKEAGGHHLGSSSLDELLTHMQQLNLGLPLVAAGGIATGADFARVYALGADACMCGTLFIATEESAAHPIFKERVVGATASDTVVTDLFRIGWQGHVHRLLHNDVVDEGGKLPPTFIGKTTILGKVYWIPRFSVAVPTISTEGEIEQMAMYCGTSCNGVHAIRPTVEVIQQFRQESQAALKSSQRQFCIGNGEEG